MMQTALKDQSQFVKQRRADTLFCGIGNRFVGDSQSPYSFLIW